MSGTLFKFVNCRILRDHNIYEDYLWVCNGKIIDPESVFYDQKRLADIEIDVGGAIIAPGFIDIQINGGFGIDFTHDLMNDSRKLDVVAKGILAHGVTSFCPTLVTSKSDVYSKVLNLLGNRKGGVHGAEVLGAHTEGPFINMTKKGAHEPKYIADFENGTTSVEEMYGDLTNIKIITLAPEKTHSMDVIKWLTQKNIVVCLAMNQTIHYKVRKPRDWADSVVLHAIETAVKISSLHVFHHRNPGLIGLLGTSCKHTVYYGLIADGIHTHTSSLRIAYRSHPKGVILVTDAVSAMGLEEGIHHIGDKKIEIRGKHAYIANTNTLCGSIATMNECIKTFIQATKCSQVEVLEAASLHPATALGVENTKGTLNFGSDADFVVLNDDLNVLSTWIAGECVYKRL